MSNNEQVDIKVTIKTEQMQRELDSIAKGLGAETVNSIVDEIIDELKNLVCPIHHLRPSSIDKPKQFGKTYVVTLENCCCLELEKEALRVIAD